MKQIKIAVLALFVCSIVIFCVFTVRDAIASKNQAPVIEAEQNTISVSVDATEEQLCAGLRATDAEDGDLTDEIMVTDISNFIDTNTCNISYAVFDSQEKLGTYTRQVVFTDYQPPHFSIQGALEIPIGDQSPILNQINAQDVLDGDISNRILVVDSTVNTSAVGLYDITVQVSNSRGDIAELTLPVTVRSASGNEVSIVLEQSLLYLKTGADFDAKAYINEQMTSVQMSNIEVQSEIDTTRPGVYRVTYSAQNTNGAMGRAYLTVVVEG